MMRYRYNDLIILIPVRLASTRFPRKALVDIHGKPKIQRIYEQVNAACFAPVFIAAGDQEIVDVVSRFTDQVVLTDPALPSGTDRIAAALREIDPSGERYDYVMNFQGDAINTNPLVIEDLMNLAVKTGADITTPAMVIRNADEVDAPSIVKIAMGLTPGERSARALYFSRAAIPYSHVEGEPYYQHVGLYLYTAEALQRFVALPPGILEQREKLEQLRALEAGMRIGVQLIDRLKIYDNAPADINTPEELEAILRLTCWI